MNEPPELLIVSLTPQNLERGALWFTQHLGQVRRARATNPWWHDNTILVEPDLVLKPAAFTRRLLDLGYERGQNVYGRGAFAVRGNVIEIWPVNTERPYLIEFTGNRISLIQERTILPPKVIEPKPRHDRGRTSIVNLTAGNYVVHEDHGIGLYRGLTQTATRMNAENDHPYFVVEYAAPAVGREPDRLFVPTDQEERLTPYVGFETPRIHRLGGSVWQNTKRKVREEAETLARELLSLYAKRYRAERPPYLGDDTLERELRSTFSYQETADQLRAEKEILMDLADGTKPMDRVLCGDVGFGKTEIAIRAALRVIASDKQVLVLAPTTVLAAQHERTFRERFRSLPVTVRALSRLTPRREEKEILADLKTGRVDCVIGTHRLLPKVPDKTRPLFKRYISRNVEFKDLGLVVIDEEQRFGVRQKERFKEMRADIDILSLSATPIPRTLQLALAKLRNISFIKTSPPERKSIQTFVLPYSRRMIQNAIRQELERGGQVYFLHNRIETIGSVRMKLEKMLKSTFSYDRRRRVDFRKGCLVLPRIGILHGRMREREVVRTMEDFRNGEINVLIATTIIENGLDISSANTLIVDDATRLGLAEAHQLRGRIGRAAEQAFAYFLYKPRLLTDKATERLEALEQYAQLGAGYEIALRDLEIRGAGNILGAEQSGAINKVGLNLYCQMLAEAVEETRGNV